MVQSCRVQDSQASLKGSTTRQSVESQLVMKSRVRWLWQDRVVGVQGQVMVQEVGEVRV